MYDEWDEVLSRIEDEHGIDVANQVSDWIDDGFPTHEEEQ